MSVQNTEFTRVFNKIEMTVDFDAAWANNTGYYDNAVKLVKLAEGQRAKSTSDNGRRMILVGTAFGTCVAFERYTQNTDSSFVIVSNVPQPLNKIIRSGQMDEGVFMNMFGYDSMNIGNLVAELRAPIAA
jgi:hypothetical protein